jgi:hypothetical protein
MALNKVVWLPSDKHMQSDAMPALYAKDTMNELKFRKATYADKEGHLIAEHNE